MLIGYARTSTVDQRAGLDAQLRDLEAAGVRRFYSEQASAIGQRPELEAALDFLRDGDTLVVTKLDRLARSVLDLMEMVEAIERKGGALKILAMDLNTSTPTGRLTLGVLGSVAEFERAIMLERQREGIEKAKAEGKYKGRAPTARRKAKDVLRLLGEGKTEMETAAELGISRASVQRIKRELRKEGVIG